MTCADNEVTSAGQVVSLNFGASCISECKSYTVETTRLENNVSTIRNFVISTNNLSSIAIDRTGCDALPNCPGGCAAGFTYLNCSGTLINTGGFSSGGVCTNNYTVNQIIDNVSGLPITPTVIDAPTLVTSYFQDIQTFVEPGASVTGSLSIGGVSIPNGNSSRISLGSCTSCAVSCAGGNYSITVTWEGTGCYPKAPPSGNPPPDNPPSNNPPPTTPPNSGSSQPPPPQPPPPPPPNSPKPPDPPPLSDNNPPPPPDLDPESPQPFPFFPTIPPTYNTDLTIDIGVVKPVYPKIAVYLDGLEVEYISWTGYGIELTDIGSYVVGVPFPSIYSSPLLSLNTLSNLKRITHAILQFDNTKGLDKKYQSSLPLVTLGASLGFTYWGNDGGDTQMDVYRYDPVRFPDALYSSQGSPSQLDRISVFKEPLVGTGWSYQLSVFSIDDSFFSLSGWQVVGKSKGLTTSNRTE